MERPLSEISVSLDAGCRADHDSATRFSTRQEGTAAMSVTTRLLTVDDLDQFPDDGKRREIIAGELYVTPAPARQHQELAVQLCYLLYQAVELTGWGKVFFAPVDVRFSAHHQVQPDLLVIRKERMGSYRGNTVHE